jgi:hypothetical protein
MTHFAPKFEVMSGDDQYRCNERLIVIGIWAYQLMS